MSNATIGMVRCPLSDELAAVRKDKRGAFYFISIAGRIAPSADFGQEWFLEHATIWGDGEPPAECPDWIRQGKSFPPFTRSRVPGARQHSSRPTPHQSAPVVAKPATPSGPERAPAVTSQPTPSAPAKNPRRNPFGLDWLNPDD